MSSIAFDPSKPDLMLDVDGVLNPFVGETCPPGYVEHLLCPRNWAGSPLTVRLNPGHRALLLELANVFNLVWATSWEDEANRLIAPLLGLPSLRVIKWHWGFSQPRVKTLKIARWAQENGERPFAWVDDQIVTAVDEPDLVAAYPWPVILRAIDPSVGLTDIDARDLSAEADRLVFSGRWPRS
ncbi:HAD domain-containing protein [Embleya sp. MST-111070]|uniref:HAD domain-containing protein n=1 Tax=Embleya sp. MST-111070 TaxID=3398231 RepID=UPI003F73A36F